MAFTGVTMKASPLALMPSDAGEPTLDQPAWHGQEDETLLALEKTIPPRPPNSPSASSEVRFRGHMYADQAHVLESRVGDALTI